LDVDAAVRDQGAASPGVLGSPRSVGGRGVKAETAWAAAADETALRDPVVDRHGIDVGDTAILIGEFQANSRETVRVSLDEFRGYRLINFRKWFIGHDGKPRPGRGGIAVQIRHLPTLAELIAQALERAQSEGLLDPEVAP